MSAYDTGTKMPIKEVRKLRFGDVLEVYYEDRDTGVLEIVLEDVAADSDHCGFLTASLDTLEGPRMSRRTSSGRSINTDRYKLVGRLAGKVTWL